MLQFSPNARGQTRQSWSEFALMGGAFGILHGTIECVLQGVWDVPLNWLDAVFTLALCGLVGLCSGLLIRFLCALGRPLLRFHQGLSTPLKRRRVFWLGMVLGHTALAVWLLIERAAGAEFAVFLVLTIIAAAVYAIAGIARAAFPARWLITALGLVWFNLAVTIFPAVAPDIASSAATWSVLTILFLPPFVCAALPAMLPSREKAKASSLRSGAVALFAVVIFGSLLSVVFMPLGLDWHVRDNPSSRSPEKPDFPNVLLIVLDTVRSDHLDVLGYERSTMPELSGFAKEHCHVAQTILATAPSTLPTHASMFTGQYSHTHGAHQPFLVHEGPRPKYGYALRDDLPTLSEHLAGLGYQTAGVVGNYGVLGGYGLSRGFDHYDVAPGCAYRGRQISWLHSSPLTREALSTLINVSLPETVGQYAELFDSRNPPYRRANEITDRSLAWLSRRDERPFFLFVNFFDAHDPYIPVREIKDRFMPKGKSVDRAGFIPHHMFMRVMRGEATIPDAWRTTLIAQYDAELFYLDGQLQRLLSTFQKMPCFDNTLIIITSDHGEGFLEHGLLRHGTSTYDTQVRVPLFVRFPKSLSDVPPEIPAWFQFVDLYPSIMHMVNEQPPQDLAGSPWGNGRRHALAEVFVHEPDIEWLRRELCTVQIGPYKYTRSTTGDVELYDLAADPGETRNIAGTEAEIEKEAERIIAERNAAIVHELTNSGEDAAMQQKLRSLGYLK